MLPHAQLPSQVRFNRGFRWVFWLILGCIALGGLVMLLIAHQDVVAVTVVLLVIAGAVATLMIARFVQAPRVTFDFAKQAILRAGSATSFAAVNAIAPRGYYREGTWLQLASDSQVIARLNVAGGLCMPPGAAQWQGLRNFISVRMQLQAGASPFRPESAMDLLHGPKEAMPAEEALRIIDDQIAWLTAGRRGASLNAPAWLLCQRLIIL